MGRRERFRRRRYPSFQLRQNKRQRDHSQERSGISELHSVRIQHSKQRE
ncbi:hypothetical protein LINGRAPRIM_LOCUS3055 [Linum grandiflorum]